jgi:hypothetical protein
MTKRGTITMEARRIVFYSTLAFSVVLEYLVRVYDWWPRLGGHMDSVMHFFWGLNLFLLSIVWLRWKPISAFYGVFAFQMGWELVEIVGDNVITQSQEMKDIFWWDGIKDTMFDMLGAGLGWLMIARIPNGLDGLKETRYAAALRKLPRAMLPGIVIGGVIWFVTGSSPQFFGALWITLSFIYAFWKWRSVMSLCKTLHL